MHTSVLYVLTFAPAVLLIALFAVLRRRRPPDVGAEPMTMARTASLNASSANERGWWVGLLPSLLLLAGTTTLLAVRWQTIPARFPIHWGLDGQPNGWVNRSVGSVFAPFIVGLAMVGGLGLLGELIARSSPGHEGRLAMVGTMRKILIGSSWFLTILLCSIGFLPLSHNPTSLVPFLLVGTAVFSLGIVGYVVYQAARMKPTVIASQNSTDRRFWKASVFYFNPEDSALTVPKRDGFGYTLNFGRPVSWLILLIFLIPLTLPLLLHVSRHR